MVLFSAHFQLPDLLGAIVITTRASLHGVRRERTYASDVGKSSSSVTGRECTRKEQTDVSQGLVVDATARLVLGRT